MNSSGRKDYMKKKIIMIGLISFVLLLAACQKDNQTESNDHTNQSDQTTSDEMESGEETDEAGNNSSPDTGDMEDTSDEEEADDQSNDSDKESQDASNVKEENFSSEQEAIDAVGDYETVEQTNTDLGYGMKALTEGAAGHEYVSWNEGKWLFVIDFPLDSQYAIDEYEDGTDMAKSIVEYLERHMLPPPEQRGVVKISGFKDSAETTIRWQKGKTVYEINHQANDPMETLEIAVDYESNN